MTKRGVGSILLAVLILGVAAAIFWLVLYPQMGYPGSKVTRLTVLSGSELADIEPLLKQIKRATNLELKFTYIGTLDGAEKIMSGEVADLVWFSHAHYLMLLPDVQNKILAQEKIMLSPVVLAVKQHKAQAWGWVDQPNVTWSEIIAKANQDELHFAMSNPTSSNSGLSVLLSVATALSGKPGALQAGDIPRITPDLNKFFKGLALTAGSSGWLADQYIKEQSSLDGIFNYESVLLELNQSGKLQEPLYLVYPQEGILSADYTILLLNPAQQEAFTRLATYLRTPEVQKQLMEQTLRRPINPEVELNSAFPERQVTELPFPNDQEVINQLLFAYLGRQSTASHAFYVLDISGSMRGERLEGLKKALLNLTGLDTSLTGQFARFRNHERITIITFNKQVQDRRTFEIDTDNPSTLVHLRQYIDGLQADGNTAIFSALQTAYQLASQARQEEPGRYYSIVLMSDGENNAGISQKQFTSFHESQLNPQPIKTFTIRFGEADKATMQSLANLTGGRMFDARAKSLTQVFKEIRGYQ